MALGPRLDLRQSQSLTMTPQLQQAIKLLALSNLEIEAFIGDALDNNPLLEAGEISLERQAEPDTREEAPEDPSADQLILRGQGEADAPLDIDVTALDRDRDTGDWSATATLGGGEEGPGIDERGDDEPTLAEHLEAQIGAVSSDHALLFVARHLIGLIDEAGYLSTPLLEVADSLGVPLARVEEALAVVQTLDPTGVGARSLSECLALQAKEADRYDPCMARLIDNLELVARGEFARLKRMCDVDDEDFADMLIELRGYDPKPGMRHGGGERAPVVPDILISGDGDKGWEIALNQATLPRLIVNRPYYVELRSGCVDRGARRWLSERLSEANSLIKALDQRQKTILKVAAEIVKQQEGFFRRGVSHLRPLTMRMVAEAIEMHESTVSRVTSNKYLNCGRGTFELKYFFTSGVASSDGEGAVSAEAVKAQIRALCEAESADDILSDDKLVELLKEKGFDLARRTVAKYREAIGIGSSVQRRRQKKLARVA
ncbi:RNA polymerase factor sigma-54 [Croceibacterium sp. LX-88]|uniref:RNA polymerase sigma-54 factor n=1 Tax=Croceibacterium selenioxidans TaxID=2838833 RepID=A0ABS5W756_9SPHN|nr:RNA polymerase factor sigma-54 [Croceibacterium selenioxidans]MBT2135590.1 RNA polymerase factor sigma-54 [Croceibacterium selenioxidans]